MKKRKVMFGVLSMMLVFSFGICTFASETKNNIIIAGNELDASMNLQESALFSVQSMYSNFEKEDNEFIYPEEFAGEYLENDELVICLTDVSDELQQKYKEWCDSYEKITFVKVKYSLNALNSQRNSFDQLNDKYKLVAYGVDVKTNSVFVQVEDKDYDNLEQYITRTRSSIPVNISVSEPIIATVSVYGGEGFGITSSGGNTLSVCIGGTYNGSNAIVSCGHGLPSVNGNVYKNGSVFGQVARKNYQGYGDYSIITLNSNYTPVNKVYSSGGGTATITGCSYYPSVGTSIYKYGKSTGYAYGSINNSDVTVNINDGLGNTYLVKGLYATSIRNSSGSTCIDLGDSGGPVFLLNNSSYKIAGIVTGKVNNQTSTYQTMYFTPIDYVTGLGFTVKTN